MMMAWTMIKMINAPQGGVGASPLHTGNSDCLGPHDHDHNGDDVDDFYEFCQKICLKSPTVATESTIFRPEPSIIAQGRSKIFSLF